MWQFAFRDFEKSSGGCLRFRPRRDGDRDYVFLTSAFGGCFAEVGRQGGPQVLNLQVREENIVDLG